MAIAVRADFGFDNLTDNNANAQALVDAWCAEYAPGVEGRVIVAVGAGGGTPDVELRADSREALARALDMWCGDSDTTRWMLDEHAYVV